MDRFVVHFDLNQLSSITIIYGAARLLLDRPVNTDACLPLCAVSWRAITFLTAVKMFLKG